VEPADIITVAEENARANGVAERVRFLQGRGTEIELPEKVDVIVSDLGGALPLFEEHIPSLISVRDRFLASDGVLIPRRDRLLCAPISGGELFARIVEPWRSVPGIDLRVAERMAMNATHAMRVEPSHLVAEPRCWAELDYTTIRSPHLHATIEWPTVSGTPIHGIALWFESVLHGDITYSSGPWSPESVHATMALPLIPSSDLRRARRRTRSVWSARTPVRALRPATPVAAVAEAKARARARALQTLRVTFARGSRPRGRGSSPRGEGPPPEGPFRLNIQATLAAGQYVITWQAGATRQSTFLSEPRSVSSLSVREQSDRSATLTGTTYRIAEHVLSRRVGDELLLLDTSAGVYHALNETGARVWELLESGREVAEIAADVARGYDIDERRAAEDVARVLAQLEGARLIRP
jgi:protein arginine N-methyltransferase 1